MSLIRPFRALRPASGKASEVLAPPYDVLNSAEARELAHGKPWSFLHVSKPEIDLPADADPYSEVVYSKAAENFRKMIDAGVLIRDAKPCYYVWRLTRNGKSQTGIAAAASVAAYRSSRIRKHELTTPVKEDDRVRQIGAIDAQTGPVMLAYRATPAIDTILASVARGKPDVDVIADYNVRHELWVVSDETTIHQITEKFEALDSLYIADGHHRSAAAERIATARPDGPESQEYFLTVIFPHDQMTVLDYNRVIKDLNGRTAAGLLAELATNFSITKCQGPMKPANAHEFAIYLDGTWHMLTVKPELVPSDPIGRLSVSLLAKYAIEPFLGVTQPRTDKRIDFVGGARGLEGLQKRVDSGEMAVAFALFPTPMDDLFAVADADEIMPPKSTWFEPKLADGMVSHILD